MKQSSSEKDYWENARAASASFRDYCLFGLKTTISENPKENCESEIVYRALPRVLYRAMTIFEMEYLIKQNPRLKTQFQGLNSSFINSSLSAQKIPWLANDIPNLVQKTSKSYPIARKLNDCLRIQFYNWRRPKLCYTNYAKFISRHINELGYPETPFPTESIISSAKTDLKNIRPNNSRINKVLLELIFDSAWKAGVSLRKNHSAYLKSLLNATTAVYEGFINKTEKIGIKAPKDLFINSPQNFSGGLIAAWASLNGSKVTAHDHGSGLLWMQNYLDGFFDFALCDRFMFFNREMIEQSNIKILDEYGLKHKLCYDGPVAYEKATQLKGFRRKKLPQKIGIICGSYRIITSLLCVTHHGFQMHGIHENLRLSLKRLGKIVSIRQHPEQQLKSLRLQETTNPNNSLLEFIGSQELLIIDMPQTTAFSDALKTDIPIILIDKIPSQFNLRAKNKIQNRCAILDIQHLEQDNEYVDELLKVAVEKAMALNCHSFYESYLEA